MNKLIIKAAILLSASLIVFSAQAQNDEGCLKKDNPLLNDSEAQILQHLKYVSHSIDFRGKRILVVTGSSGRILICKTEFFNSIKDGAHGMLSFHALTDEDKRKYGYDCIVLYAAKVPITSRLKKVVLEKSKGIVMQ